MNVLATLRRLTGMNLARNTVELAVKRRMEATGATEHKAYADGLDEAELRELVELVVVPESWLFRDPQAFSAAVAFVRQRLAEGSRLVRILSVPCAGGEEPYSMAMALFDAGVKPQAFMIDAVDISAACIMRAEAGVFGRNAFRGRELSFRDRYFTWSGDDELYRINDALRARIRFGQGSILEGELGTARQYDVIFCRNLLIYFDEPTTAAAIARLSEYLARDGMILAGYAEVPSFVRHGFRRCRTARHSPCARTSNAPGHRPGLPCLPARLCRPAPASRIPPPSRRSEPPHPLRRPWQAFRHAAAALPRWRRTRPVPTAPTPAQRPVRSLPATNPCSRTRASWPTPVNCWKPMPPAVNFLPSSPSRPKRISSSACWLNPPASRPMPKHT